MRGTSFCPPSSTDPVRIISLIVLQTHTENELAPNLLSCPVFFIDIIIDLLFNLFSTHVPQIQTTHKHTQ